MSLLFVLLIDFYVCSYLLYHAKETSIAAWLVEVCAFGFFIAVVLLKAVVVDATAIVTNKISSVMFPQLRCSSEPLADRCWNLG
jgi:hypothetical protein